MLKEEDKKRLQERFQEEASDVSAVFKGTFKQYSVKRGLRNDDGTECNGRTYFCRCGFEVTILMTVKKSLWKSFGYRGYDLTDIVKNCEKEKRFGFEKK